MRARATRTRAWGPRARPRGDRRGRRAPGRGPTVDAPNRVPLTVATSTRDDARRDDDAATRASDAPSDAETMSRNASDAHARMARERARIRAKLDKTKVSRLWRAPTGETLDRVTGLEVTVSGEALRRVMPGNGYVENSTLAAELRAAEAKAGALRDGLRRAEADLAELRRASANGATTWPLRQPAVQASDPDEVRRAGARRGTAALRKLSRARSLSSKKRGGSSTETTTETTTSTSTASVREVVSKFVRDTPIPEGMTAAPSDSKLPKPIFVVSDSTGATATQAVQAALGQFEKCMDISYPTNLEVFRFINDNKELATIVAQAKEDGAMIVYTLAEVEMSESMARMAAAAGVDAVNVWGTLLRQMEGHLEMPSMNLPMIKRPIRSSGSTNSMSSASVSAALLSSDYYRMIEAVEYTRQCDDGASSAKWKEADILILGISRTGKTPLSIFLGQRGYKVANLPLVPVNGELRIPSYIADVDPNRIFGLKISPDVLHAIRAHRLRTMGVTEAESQARSDATGVSNRAASRRSSYSDLSVVRQELDLAEALFRRNPTWKVLDVTHKGVEETAARIMAVMTERFGRAHVLSRFSA